MPNPPLLQRLMGTSRPIYEEHPDIAAFLDALTGQGAQTVGAIAGGLLGGANPVTSALGATAGTALPMGLRQFLGYVGALPPQAAPNPADLAQTFGQNVLLSAVPGGAAGRELRIGSTVAKTLEDLETKGPILERLAQKSAQREARLADLPVYVFGREGSAAPVGKAVSAKYPAMGWAVDDLGRVPPDARNNLLDEDLRIFHTTVPKTKVYDAQADPLGLREQAQAIVARKPNTTETNAIQALAKRQGYEAVLWPEGRVDLLNPRRNALELTNGPEAAQFIASEQPWQFLTHDLGTLTPEEKAAKFTALQQRLAQEGYPFVRGQGEFQGETENTLFVPHMPTDVGVAISKEGAQAYHLGHEGLYDLNTGEAWPVWPTKILHGDPARESIAKTWLPARSNLQPDAATGYPTSVYVDTNGWTKNVDPRVMEALKPEDVRKVDKMLESLPSPEEMGSLVGVGTAKSFEQWYNESRDTLKGLLGPEYYDMFSKVYGAISPRDFTPQALTRAFNVMTDLIKAEEKGIPFAKAITDAAVKNRIMQTNVPNLVRNILAGPIAVSGPKVREFTQSLLDEAGPGAIDGLTYLSALTNVPSEYVKTQGYSIAQPEGIALSQRILDGAVEAAKKAGMPERIARQEAQAAVWSLTDVMHTLLARAVAQQQSKYGAIDIGEVVRNVVEGIRHDPRILNNYQGIINTLVEKPNANQAFKNFIAAIGGNPEESGRALERQAEAIRARLAATTVPSELVDRAFLEHTSKLVEGAVTGKRKLWGRGAAALARARKGAGGEFTIAAPQTGSNLPSAATETP